VPVFSALFIALTFENYERYILLFFYEILGLIKKKIQMFVAFFNDTNNNLYYRKNCLRIYNWNKEKANINILI